MQFRRAHSKGEPENLYFCHQDHKWENKAYIILNHFLHHFTCTSEYNIYYYNSGMKSYYQSYEYFIVTVEYKHVIRITAEINWYSWHDKALITKLWQQIIKLLFIKAFGESYKYQLRSQHKEILAEPTRRYPHTMVSSSIHLSPATEGIKPWVLNCTQQDLPDRRKEKTPRICKAIWLVALLYLQEALLSVRPYIRFLLIAALVH